MEGTGVVERFKFRRWRFKGQKCFAGIVWGLIKDPCSPVSDLVLRCLECELRMVEFLLQSVVVVAEILDPVDVFSILSS